MGGAYQKEINQYVRSCVSYVYIRLHSKVKRRYLFTSLKLRLVSNLQKNHLLGIRKRFIWSFVVVCRWFVVVCSWFVVVCGRLLVICGRLWSFPVLVTTI